MWTPPTLWNHLANGFELQKLEHVSNCKLYMTKEFKIIEIEVEEDVELGSGIRDSLLPNLVLWGGLFCHSMLCKWTISLANPT